MFKVGDKVLCNCKITAVDPSHDRQHHSVCIVDSGGYDSESWWVDDKDIFPQPVSNPIICDPTSPEAKALIGKMVEFADSVSDGWKPQKMGILSAVMPGRSYPFRTGLNGEEAGFSHIRAIHETPAKKMTVSEVCAALGYNVEIVKDAS